LRPLREAGIQPNRLVEAEKRKDGEDDDDEADEIDYAVHGALP
jgi:hypothetical protein